MYCFSCAMLTLCVSFVPHLLHASSLPSTLLRVSSHSIVLLCSVSSVSISTAAFRLVCLRVRTVASFRMFSMSGVSFRWSHPLCDSSRHTLSILDASFVIILWCVPFCTISFACVAEMAPMRIAIAACSLPWPAMQVWIDRGVSAIGVSKMICS